MSKNLHVILLITESTYFDEPSGDGVSFKDLGTHKHWCVQSSPLDDRAVRVVKETFVVSCAVNSSERTRIYTNDLINWIPSQLQLDGMDKLISLYCNCNLVYHCSLCSWAFLSAMLIKSFRSNFYS